MLTLSKFIEFSEENAISSNKKKRKELLYVNCRECINTYLISYKLKFKNDFLINVSLKEKKFFSLTSFPKHLVNSALQSTGNYFKYKIGSSFQWKKEYLTKYPGLIFNSLQVILGKITQKFTKLLRKIKELLDDYKLDVKNCKAHKSSDDIETLLPPVIKFDSIKFKELFHKDPPLNFIENIVLIKKKAFHMYDVKCFCVFNEIRKILIEIGDYKKVCEEINAKDIDEFYKKLYYFQLKFCSLNDFSKVEGPTKMPLKFGEGEEYSEKCFAAIDPGIFALAMKDFQEL